jgi:hypothetical protein
MAGQECLVCASTSCTRTHGENAKDWIEENCAEGGHVLPQMRRDSGRSDQRSWWGIQGGRRLPWLQGDCHWHEAKRTRGPEEGKESGQEGANHA